MANTLNSALSNAEGYSATSDLIYNYLNRMLLTKFKEEKVFEVAAMNRTSENVGNTNKIDFKKFGEISRGGRLLETERVPIQNIDNESVTMTLYEHGNGVGITEQGRKFNSLDPFIEAINELSEDARMVHTLSVRDAFYTGTNVKYAGDATGLDDIADSSKFSFSLMEKLLTSARLQKMLPFRDGNIGNYYVAFINPINHSQIINEMQTGTNNVKAVLWEPVSSYSGKVQVFPGEVGKYQNVRLISTPLVKQGYDASDVDTYDSDLDSGTSGTNANVIEGIMAGREGVGYYDMMLPNLRMDDSDFNRVQEAAWIGYWGNVKLQNQSILKFRTGTNYS